MSEAHTRQEMIRIARLCYDRHLLVGLDGNLSVLLSDGSVLCTKAGCHKGLLTDDDLVVIDRKGRKLRGTGDPTSEMAMHLACYDARPDLKAVVHAHPPIAVAFTVAGISLAKCVLPEVVLTMGVIPTLDYRTTGTTDLAALVGEHIQQHDAVLMDRHGAVCAGSSLLEAFCRLETMEHMALIVKNAQDLGQVKQLPRSEAQHLRAMGLKRYGGPPAAVAQADLPGADLPNECFDSESLSDSVNVAELAAAAVLGGGFRMAHVTSKRPNTVDGAMADAARFSLTGAVQEEPASPLEQAVTNAVIQALKDGTP